MKSKKETLKWGQHHANKKGAVKNKAGKLITDTNELLAGENKAVDLSEEEPGRNRRGVREGQSNVNKNDT